MKKWLSTFFALLTLSCIFLFTSDTLAQTTIFVSEDAFTRSGAYADIAYGTDTPEILWIRRPRDGNIDFFRYIYFKFDLIDVSGYIDSALLQFTVRQAVGLTTDGISYDRGDFFTIEDDSWGESVITWNNQPPEGSFLGTIKFPRQVLADPKITYYLNVTEYARQELAGDKLITIMGRDDSTGNDTNTSLFSKESTEATDEQKPYLIVYTSPSSVRQIDQQPNEFQLYSNYPNPFNPSTTIRFSLPSRQDVRIEIFDLLGRNVSTLVNEVKDAGTYEIEFKGNDLPSGTYLYRLTTDEGLSFSRKMILIK